MSEKSVEVPSYFLCPISLEIMKDPVTVSTGITYDRESIERWIFSARRSGQVFCPATKQPIAAELTPNHTLRRLIQAWCVANAANGVERLPTPRAPLDEPHILRILDRARRQETQLEALRQLRALAVESERNRRCMLAAGVSDFLVSLVRKNANPNSSEEEALGVLHSLQIPAQGFVEMIVKNEDLVELLVGVLRKSSCQSRAYAAFLLRGLFEAASPARFLSLDEELFREMVRVLRDGVSHKATKAALRVLATVCPWGRNRVKAAEAGAVPVLVELLLEDVEKRACEMALVVLDQLCCCAEARAELVSHAAGLAVVTKKMIRVSPLATERAMRVIASIAKCSATPAVLQEMLQVGVVAKLCLVVAQEESAKKTKEKAVGILRLHSKSWRRSPCIPHHLQSYYPPR